ncbi:hypothetical protein EG68_11758 [Paragonimus skrjabini miyazakii]|uniref:Alpha-1,4 glucan phosphorylase n=1 Tax=Paragonimus skrjabini miyazakii TaxID=59628 RepID=A0A8S9YJG8_9TREM|nr:hypothetical protein EG68_11758 [Paragonimus skrjabini miyazakii]
MKFVNKTNGITPRRWLLLCNPGLADLLMDTMHKDESWITNMTMLSRIRTQLDDASFRLALMRVKLDNKNRFAAFLKHQRNIFIDPSSLFDVMNFYPWTAPMTTGYHRKTEMKTHVIPNSRLYEAWLPANMVMMVTQSLESAETLDPNHSTNLSSTPSCPSSL